VIPRNFETWEGTSITCLNQRGNNDLEGSFPLGSSNDKCRQQQSSIHPSAEPAECLRPSLPPLGVVLLHRFLVLVNNKRQSLLNKGIVNQ